jgi:hypothetical protein
MHASARLVIGRPANVRATLQCMRVYMRCECACRYPLTVELQRDKCRSGEQHDQQVRVILCRKDELFSVCRWRNNWWLPPHLCKSLGLRSECLAFSRMPGALRDLRELTVRQAHGFIVITVGANAHTVIVQLARLRQEHLTRRHERTVTTPPTCLPALADMPRARRSLSAACAPPSRSLTCVFQCQARLGVFPRLQRDVVLCLSSCPEVRFVRTVARWARIVVTQCRPQPHDCSLLLGYCSRRGESCFRACVLTTQRAGLEVSPSTRTVLTTQRIVLFQRHQTLRAGRARLGSPRRRVASCVHRQHNAAAPSARCVCSECAALGGAKLPCKRM